MRIDEGNQLIAIFSQMGMDLRIDPGIFNIDL